jgi:hypothetical protein
MRRGRSRSRLRSPRLTITKGQHLRRGPSRSMQSAWSTLGVPPSGDPSSSFLSSPRCLHQSYWVLFVLSVLFVPFCQKLFSDSLKDFQKSHVFMYGLAICPGGGAVLRSCGSLPNCRGFRNGRCPGLLGPRPCPSMSVHCVHASHQSHSVLLGGAASFFPGALHRSDFRPSIIKNY